MTPRFVDVGEDLNHKAHVLRVGFSYLGVPFTEWERHAGETVQVSENQRLLPVASVRGAFANSSGAERGGEPGPRPAQLEDAKPITRGRSAPH